MNRDKSSKLNETWKNVTISHSGDRDRAMLYMEDPANNELIASTSFGRHETFWRDLLTAIDYSDLNDISVLVTAMSIGCEVYDASRIAKTLGVENIHFYGHDISNVFTDIAAKGIYPYPSPFENMALDDVDFWFNVQKPDMNYMAIRPERFSNVTILPASDIHKLPGMFDIVVSNVMNPPPLHLDRVLNMHARHLSVGNHAILNSSPEFAPVVAQLRRRRSWSLAPLSTLPGNTVPFYAPDPYIA